MKLRVIATPLTIASSILLCVTGLCMLLGYRGGLVDPLHQISSILFLVGLALHVGVNWKATMAHLKRPVGMGLSAVFALLSVFAVISLGHGGDAHTPHVQARRSMDLVLDADIPTLARLTHRPESELVRMLAMRGIHRIEPGVTLRELARANGMAPMEILGIALR